MMMKQIGWIIFGIIALIYFSAIFLYSVDVPINDDYDILESISKILNNSTLTLMDKIKILFSQHNEHRIFTTRFLFLIYSKIFGNVNFTALSFIGNLSLLGICFLFHQVSKNKDFESIILIISAVFCFNFSFHENSLFAMASISNYMVVLLSIISLYILTNIELTKKSFSILVLLQILIILSNGAVLIIVFFVLIYLIFNKRKFVVSQFVFIFITVYCYFLNFNQVSQISFSKIISSKEQVVDFYLSFIASIFAFYSTNNLYLEESLTYTKFIGLFLFIIYLFLIYKKYFKLNPFIFYTVSLCLFIGLVTAINRSNYGLWMSIASRYRIYSSIICISLMYGLIELYYSKKNVKVVSMIFLILVYIFTNYIGLQFIKDLNYRNKTGVILYNNGLKNNLVGFDNNRMNQILDGSKTIYSVPKFFTVPNKVSNTPCFDMVTDGIMKAYIDEFKITDKNIVIKGYAFIPDSAADTELIIRNQNVCLKIETTYMMRYDLNSYYNNSSLGRKGFYSIIDKSKFPTGKNTLIIKIGNIYSISDKIINI